MAAAVRRNRDRRRVGLAASHSSFPSLSPSSSRASSSMVSSTLPMRSGGGGGSIWASLFSFGGGMPQTFSPYRCAPIGVSTEAGRRIQGVLQGFENGDGSVDREGADEVTSDANSVLGVRSMNEETTLARQGVVTPQEGMATRQEAVATRPEEVTTRPKEVPNKTYLSYGNVITCTHCRTHLSTRDHIVSEHFHGHGGRAFLFEHCVNVRMGKLEDRHLMTGLHVVADISCSCCSTVLGWKYVEAFEERQKYKVGKFILERCNFLMEDHYNQNTPAPGDNGSNSEW
ncbi:unnamed protein product [Choristocarpus tenellus]